MKRADPFWHSGKLDAGLIEKPTLIDLSGYFYLNTTETRNCKY
jgi:hypothetical protein